MSDRIRFGDAAQFAVEVAPAAEGGLASAGGIWLVDRGRAVGGATPPAAYPELAGWYLRQLSLHRPPGPLVLAGPATGPLAGVSLEVGHPAAARAALRGFADWVAAGAAPAAAAPYVDAVRFAQQVAAAQERRGWWRIRLPTELLSDWDALVADCEAGYDDSPDELANDLSVRAAIQLALDESSPDDPQRARLATALEPLDRRFRVLLPADAPGMQSRPWWERGMPIGL